jgi:hypothetical protein
MTETASVQPRLTIKTATRGAVYVDGTRASTEEMVAAAERVKAGGGFVAYYRESPRSDPTEAANDVFKRLIATGTPIRLGHQVESEWGTLDWIEVEEAPQRWRFFMARGQRFLIAQREADAQEPNTYVGGPMSPEDEDRWLGQVDILVRSDRVIETIEQEPHRAFDAAALGRPSLHLRVGYGAGRRWQSHFPADIVPAHIRSFQQDLERVGHHLVASTDPEGWKVLSRAEAAELF